MSKTPQGRVVQAFLGNPFEVSDSERQAAERILDGVAPAQLIAESAAHDDPVMLKRLVLAVGHWQAIRAIAPPEQAKLAGQALDPERAARVLDAATLPAPLLRRLPSSRAAYRRVALAAGRCYAALSAFLGHSTAAAALRRDTWASCFGRSLHHALALEAVIRDHDVLVLGETGTGKELVGRALQAAHLGGRDGGLAPHAAINAAALPETLVESALFGHVRGAFTGATTDRVGRIRSASGGCLFLDEVGDLPLTTQVKLLRVIESNEVTPLGSDQAQTVDVRYVAATHKDLEQMADRGTFRRDLFERLAGNVIRCPPLRERPEDIREIGLRFVQPYLARASDALDTGSVGTWLSTPAAREHPWRGNVRELQSVLRDLLLGLPASLRGSPQGPAPGGSSPSPRPAGADDSPDMPRTIREGTATLHKVEQWYLRKVVGANQGNVAGAARVLGVDRSTVKRRLGD